MCAVETMPVIATERLLLRRPARDDIQPLLELVNDINLAGRTQLPHPFARADAEHLIAGAGELDGGEAGFAVEHRNFGLVGMLGFAKKQPARPELGCWIGRPFWNRGYATEAIRAALRWAKHDWRKRVVTAGHFADCPAAGQVLCKAGFLYTGDVELRTSRARGREVATRMMVWLA